MKIARNNLKTEMNMAQFRTVIMFSCGSFDKNNITLELYLYRRRFDRKTDSPQKISLLEKQNL